MLVLSKNLNNFNMSGCFTQAFLCVQNDLNFDKHNNFYHKNNTCVTRVITYLPTYYYYPFKKGTYNLNCLYYFCYFFIKKLLFNIFF